MYIGPLCTPSQIFSLYVGVVSEHPQKNYHCEVIREEKMPQKCTEFMNCRLIYEMY